MTRIKKRTRKFDHPVDLRDSKPVKKIRQALGSEGVLFFYYMWEVLSSCPGFRVEVEGLEERLSDDFEILRINTKRYLTFCTSKKIFQVKKGLLRCDLLEEVGLADVLEKRERDAQRKRKQREGKKVKKEEKVEKVELELELDVKQKESNLQTWIKDNAPRVNKMQKPLTYDESIRIRKELTNKVLLKDVLMGMENKRKLITDYASANLTIRSWYRMREQGKELSKSARDSMHDDSEVSLKKR